jgi:hypothetical protein
MSKIQTIIWLFVFLIVIFSMDMIFGNPIRESFKGIGVAGGRDVSTGSIGADYIPSTKITNGGFLAAPIPDNYKTKSDDEPLHFSFPF